MTEFGVDHPVKRLSLIQSDTMLRKSSEARVNRKQSVLKKQAKTIRRLNPLVIFPVKVRNSFQKQNV